MKIGVLFDGMSALGANPDVLILESVEAVENAIADWGHRARPRPGQSRRTVGRAGAPREVRPRLQSLRRHRRRRGARAAGDLRARAVWHSVHRELEHDDGAVPAEERREHAARPRGPSGSALVARAKGSEASERRLIPRSASRRQKMRRSASSSARWSAPVARSLSASRRCTSGGTKSSSSATSTAARSTSASWTDEVLPIAEIHFGEMPRGHVEDRLVPVQVDHGQRRGPRRDATCPARSSGQRGARAEADRRHRVDERSAAPGTAAWISASTSEGRRGSSR